VIVVLNLSDLTTVGNCLFWARVMELEDVGLCVCVCVCVKGREIERVDRDHGTYKVFESVGSEMKVGHDGKEPDYRIRNCLLETVKRAGSTLVLNRVGLDARVGELSLVGSEPLCSQRKVGKVEEAKNGNEKGDDAL
jgi:hypothetical protein